jgi:hypothetical protein
LLGSGGLADFIPKIMKTLPAPVGTKLVYDTHPGRLVKQVVAHLDLQYADFKHMIKSLEERPKKVGRG